jgi:hypothetical protein
MKEYEERKAAREKEAAEAAADPAKAKVMAAAAAAAKKDALKPKDEGDDEDAEMSPAPVLGMMAGVKDDDPRKKNKEQRPTTVLGRYAKVLLSSHEFLFVR